MSWRRLSVHENEDGRLPARASAERVRLSDRRERQRRLFCIHGIRTNGEWQDELARVMTKRGILVSNFPYGYYGLSSFVRADLRNAVVGRFVAWFKTQTAGSDLENPEFRPSIVGHSFGANVVAEAMLADRNIKVHSFILSGGMLPLDFPWATLFGRGQVERVRNECAGRDFWVSLVARLLQGMGASGRRGFSCSSPRLRNVEYRHYGHCDYLHEDHFAEHWAPYLYGAREEPQTYSKLRPAGKA